MKNLKRIFSLALAGTMLAGMLTIGASAADFTDADEIVNADAVNFMVALGIIDGNDDGSFAPERTVSRAEMAKMITIALNGGSDPVLGTNSVSYTDTANHWAKNYIEYCTNLGIISGRGNGIFDPDKGVTGSEAAKMILVAMGYQSDWFGFTGADWEINVNIQANDATITTYPADAGDDASVVGVTSVSSLYKGLPKNFDPSAPLSRDDAAQIINNGIKADMMVRGQITVTGNGTEYSYTKRAGTTILNSKFDVKMEHGILTASTYVEDDETFSYTIDGEPYTFADNVADFFGQKVEVVMKNDTDETVLGIAAYDSSVLATGVVNNLALNTKNAKQLKVGKTNLTTKGDAAEIEIQIFNEYDADNAETVGTVTADDYDGALKGFYAIEVIDNDGDKKADVVVAHPVTVEEVKNVSRTAITTTKSYKFEDNTIADDIAKGDWVIVTEAKNTAEGADGKAIIEKAEVLNGTIRSVKDDKEQAQIGSTWYETATTAIYDKIKGERGEKYDLVVFNGYIHNAEKASGTAAARAEDTLYVLAIDAPATGVNYGTQQIKALFADGTESVVTVVTVNDKDVSDNDNDSNNNEAATEDKIYSYSIDKNGRYELADIRFDEDDADESDYDAKGVVTNYAGSAENVKDGEITADDDSYRFADNAVVFVVAQEDGKKTVKALTGKTINGWDDFKATDALLYANTDDGFLFTALGVITLPGEIPGLAGDTHYGYLTADAVATTDDNDEKCTEFTIWNGEEEITVVSYEKNLTMSNFKRDAVISYKIEGVDEITKVTALEGNGLKTGAVRAYTEGRTAIRMHGSDTAYTLDKDAVIIYVNVDAHEGVESGTIRLADEALNSDGSVKTGVWNTNVKFLDKGDAADKKTITVIFVETDNDFGGEVSGS